MYGALVFILITVYRNLDCRFSAKLTIDLCTLYYIIVTYFNIVHPRYHLHQRCFVTLCTAISLWTVLNYLSALSHMPLLREILFHTYVASTARNYDSGERFREIYTFHGNGNVRKRIRNYRKLNEKPISRKCHNILDHF